MSRSKFLILFSLVLLMAGTAGVVHAQTVGQGSGTVTTADSLAKSDKATFSMTDVAQPPEGFVYEGWLVSDDGSDPLSTGIINVRFGGSVNHVFTSPDGENLIASRNKAVISVEPVDDSDPAPSDDKPYFDEVPLAAMTHIRHLLVSWPEGEENGILTNLQLQLDVALQHAMLARTSDNIDDVRLHMHHVINIIEGEDGPNFDDSFGNPGDGIGVVVHAQDRKHAGFAISEAPGDPTIRMQGEMVEQFGANAENWSIEARDGALNVLQEDRLNVARTLINTIEGRLNAARNGIQATGQGGAQQAYVQAQMMAKYNFPSMRGTAPAAPTGPSVGVLLPRVGDTAIPALAQYAFIGSVVFLVAGVFLMIRDRRSRRKA